MPTADAQVASMLVRDNGLAVESLSFVQEVQANIGDRAGALDSLRVGELRVIDAKPEGLAGYHAAVADVWAILKDSAKAGKAIDAALAQVPQSDPFYRTLALADIAYAQTLIGDGT